MKAFAVLVVVTVCIVAFSVFAQPVTVEVEKVPVKASSPDESVGLESTKPRSPVKASSPGDKAEPVSAKPNPEGNKLRLITDFNTPPFSFKEGMEPVGFEIDLADAIAKELGERVEWIQKGFNINTYASALDAGSADAAIASITINDERKKKLDFTRPYFRTSLSVAARKDVDWKHNDFTTGLKDWVVGVVKNTTSEDWARKELAAEIKTYATPERLASALKDTKFEKHFCIIFDHPLLIGVLDRQGYRFEIVEKAFEQQSYGIAVKKGNTELISKLNAALDELDKNGVYDKLYYKWYTKAEDSPLLK